MTTLAMGQVRWLIVAGVLGGAAVGLGAIGAHMLKPRLVPQDAWAVEQISEQNPVPQEVQAAAQVGERRMENFKLAVEYHFWHAAALLATVPLADRRFDWARMLWMAGIVLFSGGLYLYAVTGETSWAHIVPVGGVAFIAGWLALALAALRLSRSAG